MVMIIKANGDREKFEEKRLFNSLKRAGAETDTAKRVIAKVKPNLHDGITTRKIYSMAFRELRKVDNPTASRYEIKWAMMRLGGKQGFSFEQYMAKLFEKVGYKVKLNTVIRGKHITHEVDLILEKGNKRFMVECKHRSKPGIWVHVQTPLYVYARLLDMKKDFDNAYVITNTRFTNHSKQYAKGVGVKLISWDNPKGGSLRELIDSHKIYPVTVLKTVDDNILRKFLEKKIVVVPDILEYKKLDSLIGKQKAYKVLEEAKELLRRR